MKEYTTGEGVTDQKKAKACIEEEVISRPTIIGTTFRFNKFVYSHAEICKLKDNLRHKDAWILSQDDKTWYLSYNEKIVNIAISEGRHYKFR